MITGIKEPLTAAELSFILNISEQTVKRLAKNQELPHGYRKGRQLCFELERVTDYFRELEGGAA